MRKVAFAIWSRDDTQSFAAIRTYPLTWFDAVAQGPGREARTFEKLLMNNPMQRSAGLVVIDMRRSDEASPDPEARRRAEWVSKLQSGDVISLLPRRFSGEMHVIYAKIDVYTAYHRG